MTAREIIMRKVLATSLLFLVAVIGVASKASADLIPIGALQWNPEEGIFSIHNQTADNSFPPDLPVSTFVDFSGIVLTLDGTTDLTVGSGLTDVNAGDASLEGYDFDSAVILPGSFPHSATIGGAVVPGVVQISGGGKWFISGSFMLCVPEAVDPGSNDCGDQDLGAGAEAALAESGVIYVTARKVVQVPEPVSMSLVGLGLAGVALRRRRASKN
jgi:hypothetical protein